VTDELGRGEDAVDPTTTASPSASGSTEADAPGHGAAGSTILVAGASSESGYAVSSALLAAGAHVVAVSSGRAGLDALRSRLPAVDARQCDLSDSAAVAELADGIRDRYDRIDGLIHLVGGWRGGGGLPGQTDEDWAILDRSFATLRVTSRELYPDLLKSPAARLAIVSSTSVDHPAPGGANYASAKAAAETWVRAIAKGFASSGDAAAAVIFVVKALAGREPELAERVAGLWSAPAAQLNGSRIPLSN
jgi:NAD(P)-dependent dehydrogenase (short-subunit alcohol dehydrogenase family)